MNLRIGMLRQRDYGIQASLPTSENPAAALFIPTLAEFPYDLLSSTVSDMIVSECR